jgi:type IV secretion system protein VirB3
MDGLKEIPIYRALHRPNFILGGERELVLFALILFGGIGITSLNLIACVMCGILWLVSIAGLRMMAKTDPYMSRVYLRQLKYSRYYHPRSTPYCEF